MSDRGTTDWGWPGGAAVAVSITFDVDAESGFLGEGEEYRRRITTLSEGAFGVRRGVPRILGLLERLGIPATFFVPGDTAERHPGLCAALLEGGHEIGHHGYLHLRSDKVSAEAQREEIERGLEALAAAGAPVPRGYRSTSWELTPETFALLRRHGFAYDSSCMGDDRPYLQEWEGERILELPVHWSLDDWPRFGWAIDGGGNVADVGELRDSWLAEFRAAREEGRHVTFTMHPEVIGRAYRFAALEALVEEMVAAGDVWFARLDEVADHVGPRLAEAAAPGR
ncbi:MAG: polysaccharide deacetylase [Actinobacteria bacterium]|nr:polysaccharide deacetylase [Actinomycetota bacterium]